jgi:hypothetical protein
LMTTSLSLCQNTAPKVRWHFERTFCSFPKYGGLRLKRSQHNATIKMSFKKIYI